MKKVSLLCLALAGCVSQPAATPSARYVPYPIEDELRLATESGIRSIMKDPDSARFNGMIAVETPEHAILICGYVNGKNSFGGYVGDKPFMAGLTMDNRFVQGSIADTENSVLAHLKTCRDSNLPI